MASSPDSHATTEPQNPWNAFQRRLGGTKTTRAEVAALCQEEKAAAMRKDLAEPQKTQKLVEDEELSAAQGHAIARAFQGNATKLLEDRADGSIVGREFHE